jgi:FAD/FMN-containing dehydrogenase
MKRATGNKAGNSPYSSELADRIAMSREPLSSIVGKHLPDYVAMPGSLEEVQEILKAANEENVPVYPYSRGTSVYGFTLPLENGISLDLHRMDRILEINEETMTATVEPGVTWGMLRKEALKKKLMIIPILGPHSGGVIGNFTSWNFTHAGTRYSPDRVVSLELVLANGEILRTGSAALAGHESSNPYFRYAFGPDITGLFRGSLGTLGIVTKAVIKLYPILDGQKNITYAFDELRPALDAMQRIEKLDISRHIAVYSKEWIGEMCDPQLKHVNDVSGQEKIMGRYPDWLLNIGICGTTKQMGMYEELIRDEVGEGREHFFEGTEKTYWEDFAAGAGSRVTSMYGSSRNAMTTLSISPFSTCAAVYERALEKIKEADFRDPVSGAAYEPMTFYFPCDRGRVVYGEMEYRYEATDPESVGKAVALWDQLSRLFIEEYGSSLMIFNPMIMNYLMPSYADALKGIKNLFDPRGILARGQLFDLSGSPLKEQ